MKRAIGFFLLFCFLGYAEETRKRVDFVTYDAAFLPSEECCIKYHFLKEKYTFNPSFDLYRYVRNFTRDDPNLQKIIFLDYCKDMAVFKLPKKKMICFKWEAVKIAPIWYMPYSVVYTFDDDLVDGKKFFYPVLQPMIQGVPTFEEKKLCIMVAKNWIPERLKLLEFFATKPLGELEVYGDRLPDRWCHHKMFKGSIPGSYSGREKLDTLKKYRFSICFENTHTIPGYITEKIFDVFASGSVPIYWGPGNVEKYIPKNCFIDYRDFKTNEEMYRFIKSMPRDIYERYIENIRKFLKSDQAALFSVENFERLLDEAVRK